MNTKKESSQTHVSMIVTNTIKQTARKKQQKNIFAKDIISCIASEFLYHVDASNLISCCKDLNATPYQYNFHSNKNIKIKKSFEKTIYFNKLTVVMIISLNILPLCQN